MAFVHGTMVSAASSPVEGGLIAGWEAGIMSDLPKTPGGSGVHLYPDEPIEPRAPEHPRLHLDELKGFLAEFLGPPGVLYEAEPETVFVDILAFPPHPFRNNWTLVTAGMSDLPMSVPDHIEPREQFERTELVVVLPPDWFVGDEHEMLSQAELRVHEKFWPIALMGFLARLPHQQGSWLWERHTVAVGTSPRPFADNTKMSGAIVLPLTSWPPGRDSFVTEGGETINFLAVIPLHADEMTLKLNKGSQALTDALDAAGYNEVLIASRPSVARRKSLFGCFKR